MSNVLLAWPVCSCGQIAQDHNKISIGLLNPGPLDYRADNEPKCIGYTPIFLNEEGTPVAQDVVEGVLNYLGYRRASILAALDTMTS